MNIELTQKEFRDLLDVLHIADVVLSGHRRMPDPRSETHRALIQKLYELSDKAGLEGLMEKKEAGGASVPTPQFEKSTLAHAAIDEFGDHLFWDELIGRLAVRDASRAVGGMDHLNALGEQDRHAAEGPLRQRYIQEFSKNGLANIVVIEDFTGSGITPAATSD
jgi:hypothetical protein